MCTCFIQLQMCFLLNTSLQALEDSHVLDTQIREGVCVRGEPDQFLC